MTTANPTRASLGASPHRYTADERRADVIEVAVRAFASNGLAGTSTEEIARLAGVSQPYLFRLFGTKRNLFLAAVERSFDRIGGGFEDAALHPVPVESAGGMNPRLLAIARSYGELVRDQSLLRLQLHAFAACDDPVVREVVRERFSRLVRRVSELAGEPEAALRSFFAEGMLMNVAAAMDLSDADVAWDRICDGGPA